MLLDHQFRIHNAIKDKVVMYRWLVDIPDMVPKYSTFYAACGGVALVDDEVLVVQESNVIIEQLRAFEKDCGECQVVIWNVTSL
jgi:hypothetical protein